MAASDGAALALVCGAVPLEAATIADADVAIRDASPEGSELLIVTQGAAALACRLRREAATETILRRAAALAATDRERIAELRQSLSTARDQGLVRLEALTRLLLAESYLALGSEAQETQDTKGLLSAKGEGDPSATNARRLWKQVRRVMVPSAVKLLETEYQTALKHAELACAAFERAAGLRKEEEACRGLLARIDIALGHFDRGVAHATKRHELACLFGGLPGVLDAMIALGVAQHTARRFGDAEATYAAVEQRARDAGDIARMAAAKGGRACALRKSGKAREALRLRTEQLDVLMLQRRGKLPFSHRTRLLAVAVAVLQDVSDEEPDISKVLSAHSTDALRLRHLTAAEVAALEGCDEGADIGYVAFELGRDLHELGRRREARDCFLEALVRWERAAAAPRGYGRPQEPLRRKDTARALSWAARCEEELGTPYFEDARNSLRRLHHVVNELGMTEDEAGVLLRRARLEEAHGQYATASELYGQCVEVWDRVMALQGWQGRVDQKCEYEHIQLHQGIWQPQGIVDRRRARYGAARCQLHLGRELEALALVDDCRGMALQTVLIRKAEKEDTKQTILPGMFPPDSFAPPTWDALFGKGSNYFSETAQRNECTFLVYAMLGPPPQIGTTADADDVEADDPDERCSAAVWVVSKDAVQHTMVDCPGIRVLVEGLPALAVRDANEAAMRRAAGLPPDISIEQWKSELSNRKPSMSGDEIRRRSRALRRRSTFDERRRRAEAAEAQSSFTEQWGELRAALSELWETLIAPVRDWLPLIPQGDSKALSELVCVCPDGCLWGVPWGALLDASAPPAKKDAPPGRHFLQYCALTSVHSVRTFNLTGVLAERFAPPELEEDEDEPPPTHFYACGKVEGRVPTTLVLGNTGDMSAPLVTAENEAVQVIDLLKGRLMIDREARRHHLLNRLKEQPPAAMHLAAAVTLRQVHGGNATWRGAIRLAEPTRALSSAAAPVQMLTAQELAGLRLGYTPLLVLSHATMWWDGIPLLVPEPKPAIPSTPSSRRGVAPRWGPPVVAAALAAVGIARGGMWGACVDPCDKPVLETEIGRSLSWELRGQFTFFERGFGGLFAAERFGATPGMDLIESIFATEVPSVVASLWRADSGFTTDFLCDFWCKLVDHEGREVPRDKDVPRDEAFRHSVLAAIDSGAHPAEWAPFALFGFP